MRMLPLPLVPHVHAPHVPHAKLPTMLVVLLLLVLPPVVPQPKVLMDSPPLEVVAVLLGSPGQGDHAPLVRLVPKVVKVPPNKREELPPLSPGERDLPVNPDLRVSVPPEPPLPTPCLLPISPSA